MHSHNSAPLDAAVVGRGAVGLAAALALARAGLKVGLVGPAPAPPRAASALESDGSFAWDTRVFALSPASRELLDSIGVWHALAHARVAPVYDMRVHPRFGSRDAELHFSAYEARVEALAWIVENRNLMQALQQAIRFAGIPTFDSAVAGFDPDADRSAALLRLEDGRELKAKLVVGADGAQSPLRSLAAIPSALADYPQRALVANFDTERPHRDCAFQWLGRDGILALLPLPLAPSEETPQRRGRCSIVWSAPTALADELQALEPEAVAQRVADASARALGAMTPITRVEAWPLRLGTVTSLIGPRLALVGDAAHVVHPLAGQGMNLGFGDVIDLAAAMRGRKPGADPGERPLLRRYERARAEPVAAMRLATDGLQKLFDADRTATLGALQAPLVAARELGWRAVASSGWLKRQLIGQAVR